MFVSTSNDSLVKLWDTSRAIRTTEFEDYPVISYDHTCPVISSDVNQIKKELASLDVQGKINVWKLSRSTRDN